jgi:hypothetical protein
VALIGLDQAQLRTVEVLQDGGQVVLLPEAPGLGRPLQRLIDLWLAEQGRELDRTRHLGAHTLHSGAGGGPEPALGAPADGQEALLGLRPRSQLGLGHAATVGLVRVVLVDDEGRPGVESSCRTTSVSPRSVRATMTSSSPSTRHQTSWPASPSGVE